LLSTYQGGYKTWWNDWFPFWNGVPRETYSGRQGIVNRTLPSRLLLTPPKREEQFSVLFPSIHVGGRLTHFLSQWEKITERSITGLIPPVFLGTKKRQE
jgi:hypothetical protein